MQLLLPNVYTIEQQQQLITQPSQGKTDTNLLENISYTHIHTHTYYVWHKFYNE